MLSALRDNVCRLYERAVPALRAETGRRVWIQWTIVKSNFYTLCISQESQRKKNKMGNRPARSPIIRQDSVRQPRRGSINVAEETVLINLQTV